MITKCGNEHIHVSFVRGEKVINTKLINANYYLNRIIIERLNKVKFIATLNKVMHLLLIIIVTIMKVLDLDIVLNVAHYRSSFRIRIRCGSVCNNYHRQKYRRSNCIGICL